MQPRQTRTNVQLTLLPRTPFASVRDGILDMNELESIYGVHHEKRRKASGDSVEVHTEKAKEIVKEVLAKLDTNGDGVLTMREFVAGGVGGLPNFKGVEHLGHHYGACAYSLDLYRRS